MSHWWADASITKFPANISSIGFGLHQRKIMSYSGFEDKQGLELRRKATWRSIKVVTGTFFTQTQTTSLSPSHCSFIHLQKSMPGREGHLPVRVSALFPCKSSPAVSGFSIRTTIVVHVCVVGCAGKMGKDYLLAWNRSSTVLRVKYSLFDEVIFIAGDNWPIQT